MAAITKNRNFLIENYCFIESQNELQGWGWLLVTIIKGKHLRTTLSNSGLVGFSGF
jgi:hypothetical protein